MLSHSRRQSLSQSQGKLIRSGIVSRPHPCAQSPCLGRVWFVFWALGCSRYGAAAAALSLFKNLVAALPRSPPPHVQHGACVGRRVVEGSGELSRPRSPMGHCRAAARKLCPFRVASSQLQDTGLSKLAGPPPLFACQPPGSPACHMAVHLGSCRLFSNTATHLPRRPPAPRSRRTAPQSRPHSATTCCRPRCRCFAQRRCCCRCRLSCPGWRWGAWRC